MTIADELKVAGWLPSHRTAMEVFYRWEGAQRVELHVVYDRGGAIASWSEWHSKRITIDQQPGRRARLMERARTIADHP